MKRDDEVLLLLREAAALQVGAEVVDPPQAAALAAPLQPCTHARTTARGNSAEGMAASVIEQWSGEPVSGDVLCVSLLACLRAWGQSSSTQRRVG